VRELARRWHLEQLAATAWSELGFDRRAAPRCREDGGVAASVMVIDEVQRLGFER
jgi:hypothetical protein